MAKIEKKWIVQVWDDKNSRHEYLVVFGTKMTPLLSQARAKARATSWDIAQRGAQMVKQQTGKLARVILK